jgi:protein-L-isoaspartate(D-aspartate) O-methyltransferase
MHGYALVFIYLYGKEYMKNHLATATSVLDVGSGSGYLVAAIHKMMKNSNGKVIGIEHIPELVSKSIVNLSKYY